MVAMPWVPDWSTGDDLYEKIADEQEVADLGDTEQGFTPDQRFADDNGDVPWFSPEPALPGESDDEWTAKLADEAEFDRAMAAWEAKHEGPDIVQDLSSWRAEHEDSDEDGDEA